MAKITFKIQTENNPAAIYVRLRDGRKLDTKAKTNYHIDPKNWSKKKGIAFERDGTGKIINAKLKNMENELLAYYNNRSDLEVVNTQWLKDFINPPKEVSQVPTKLVDYCDYYLVKRKVELTSGSFVKYRYIKDFIVDFERFKNKKYDVNDVDEDFKVDFLNYMISRKYSQNYISKIFDTIKVICRHAGMMGVPVRPNLSALKISKIKRDILYLTLDEIKAIENVTLTDKRLDNARDWLLISCETAQRVSDFLNFKKSMIGSLTMKDGSKINAIEFVQKKTKKPMHSPITPRIQRILDKRGGEFPNKSCDQKYNKYIKEVCRLAGITQIVYGGKQINKRKIFGEYPKYELVTSHIGRRSFASNNYGKIPTSVIMIATGHASEKQLLEYIGKDSSEKAAQLAEYLQNIE